MSRRNPTSVSKAEAARQASRERQEQAWRNRIRKLSSCSCLHPVPGRRYFGTRVCERCGMPLWEEDAEP